jgi:hypothetical protein
MDTQEPIDELYTMTAKAMGLPLETWIAGGMTVEKLLAEGYAVPKAPPIVPPIGGLTLEAAQAILNAASKEDPLRGRVRGLLPGMTAADIDYVLAHCDHSSPLLSDDAKVRKAERDRLEEFGRSGIDVLCPTFASRPQPVPAVPAVPVAATIDDIKALTLADLARSGLNAEHAHKMGLLVQERWTAKSGTVFPESYKIPYYGPDGKPADDYYRTRFLNPFYPRKDSTKPQKYTQPKNSRPHLYFTPLGTDWPKVLRDPAIPLIFAEGEKKAASVCALTSHTAIGIGGVNSWQANNRPLPELASIALEGRKVLLCWDSDTWGGDNPRLESALNDFAAWLVSVGAKVYIIRLHNQADGSKSGADDVIANSGAAVFDSFCAQAAEWLDQIAIINRDHAFTMIMGKACVLIESVDPFGNFQLDYSTPASIYHELSNQYIAVGEKTCELGSAWMHHERRRQYKSVVFDPTRVIVPGHYNLWRGFQVDPKQGDWSLMQWHILYIICSGVREHYEYLLDWMAHAIQFPGERPGVAPVLRGDEGIGKGEFVKFFGQIFGGNFVSLYSDRQLTGNFNALTQYAYLLCADEAVWGGNKQAEGTLKGMVTEESRIIEPKNFNAFPIRNFIRLIMTANKHWVVPAGPGARRWFCLDVSDAKKEDAAYHSALRAQMKDGGVAAMLFDLQHRLITNIVQEAPRTAGLLDQKVQSMDQFESWLIDFLTAEGLQSFCTKWQRHHLHQAYMKFADDHKHARPLDPNLFGRRLRQALDGTITDTRPAGGGRCYLFAPLELLRKHVADKWQTTPEALFGTHCPDSGDLYVPAPLA